MKLPENLDRDAVIEAVQRDEPIGFCIACGEETYGIEPDARGYRCESCDADGVYGAAELLIEFIA